ncbi:MAG: pyridoxal-dependent decarboxylase [Hyphomicrobiales bacterium]
MRFYCSDQAHSCHRKAVQALRLGNASLRRIPTDAEFRIDIIALRNAIRADRAAGMAPACVIGTAGTVNTGAIGDLGALADIAGEEDLWFHVYGCIGALLAIARSMRIACRARAGSFGGARSAQMAACAF